MMQEIQQEHRTDEFGNPAGGHSEALGIHIDWQDGPLKNPDGTAREPSGAFVEGVIQAAIGRLEFYQQGRFACPENKLALDHLNEALKALNARTQDRIARGVEGTLER